MPEFFGEQVDTEHGCRAKYRRPEFECCDVGAKEKQRERLQVDKQPFPSAVVGIEELVIAGFIGAKRIDAIHGFVRIEPGGEMLDIPEAQKERYCQKYNKNGNRHQFFRREKMPEEMSSHNERVLFLS